MYNYSVKDKPSLRDLYWLGYCDHSGKKNRLLIIDTVAAKWKKIGFALTFTNFDLNKIEHDLKNEKDCCSELLSRWVQGAVAEPVSWQKLLEVLNDIHYTELAQQLSVILSQKG